MLGLLRAAAASPQGGQKGRDREGGGISHWEKLKGRQCPNWEEPRLGDGKWLGLGQVLG